MGYRVKWVEENLGVSRKALRNFERMGLMPQNKNCQYRDYDDEDIDRIWTIRVLQGMGYTLKEIVDMVNNENFDFEYSIGEKIKQLEKRKMEIERHFNYAKTIKLTGRFPSRPEKIGSINFEEFYEKSLTEWNIGNDPETEQLQVITDMILEKSCEEWQETDLGRLLDCLSRFNLDDSNMEEVMNNYFLPRAIAKRISLGTNHPEVQLLVKLIYENQRDHSEDLGEMSQKQFARLYSLSYIAGDIARINEMNYGIKECRFIADAVAVFGGYSGINDPNIYI